MSSLNLITMIILSGVCSFASEKRTVEFFMSDYCTQEQKATVTFTGKVAEDYKSCHQVMKKNKKDPEVWAVKVDGIGCKRIEPQKIGRACQSYMPEIEHDSTMTSVFWYASDCTNNDMAPNFGFEFSDSIQKDEKLCRDLYIYGEYEHNYFYSVDYGMKCEQVSADRVELFKLCRELLEKHHAKRAVKGL